MNSILKERIFNMNQLEWKEDHLGRYVGSTGMIKEGREQDICNAIDALYDTMADYIDDTECDDAEEATDRLWDSLRDIQKRFKALRCTKGEL
jgi:hypothetical protein